MNNALDGILGIVYHGQLCHFPLSSINRPLTTPQLPTRDLELSVGPSACITHNNILRELCRRTGTSSSCLHMTLRIYMCVTYRTFGHNQWPGLGLPSRTRDIDIDLGPVVAGNWEEIASHTRCVYLSLNFLWSQYGLMTQLGQKHCQVFHVA